MFRLMTSVKFSRNYIYIVCGQLLIVTVWVHRDIPHILSGMGIWWYSPEMILWLKSITGNFRYPIRFLWHILLEWPPQGSGRSNYKHHFAQWVMSLGGPCCSYYPGTLSYCQASATHMNFGTRSSNGLQWLDLKLGHQESSPNNCRQSDMPYYVVFGTPDSSGHLPVDGTGVCALTH